MWEWRVFYSGLQEPYWISRITEMLYNIPVEERSDLYFNLYSPEFGIKIRSFSETYQLLELKILQKTEGDLEYWEKPIKQTLQVIESGNINDTILFSLENLAQKYSYIKKIIKIFKSGNCNEIEITKNRKKITIDEISIESVRIEYNNKTKMSVQLECHSSSFLYEYLHKTLEIPINEYSNISYPRFLMEL